MSAFNTDGKRRVEPLYPVASSATPLLGPHDPEAAPAGEGDGGDPAAADIFTMQRFRRKHSVADWSHFAKER